MPVPVTPDTQPRLGTATSVTEPPSRSVPSWRRTGLLVGPLLLLGVAVGLVLVFDPVTMLRGDVVPVEQLDVESVRLAPNEIEASVRNVSSSAVTIAQVLVNDAYWNHTITQRELTRLEGASLTIAYPWDEGVPLHLSFLTAAGSRIDHEIPVALPTPARDVGTASRYASLGLLIGVVPIAIGLLWFPALRALSRHVRDFVVALTAGLLAFLLVDTLEAGLGAAERTGSALNGVGLVVVGAVFLLSLVVLVEESVMSRRRDAAASGKHTAGLGAAYVFALAIGLHNLGEGLAVGASVAAGEVALGTTLVLGFMVHNSTEGLAIALPITAMARLRAVHFVGLTLVAGVPAAAGAVIGSWAVAPAWVALAFGAAVGALGQVLWTLGRGFLISSGTDRRTVTLGFGLGLGLMYATGLLTG